MGTFYIILYDYIHNIFSYTASLHVFCQLLDILCSTSARSQSLFGFVLESLGSPLCVLIMLYFIHLAFVVPPCLPAFYDKLILSNAF